MSSLNSDGLCVRVVLRVLLAQLKLSMMVTQLAIWIEIPVKTWRGVADCGLDGALGLE